MSVQVGAVRVGAALWERRGACALASEALPGHRCLDAPLSPRTVLARRPGDILLTASLPSWGDFGHRELSLGGVAGPVSVVSLTCGLGLPVGEGGPRTPPTSVCFRSCRMSATQCLKHQWLSHLPARASMCRVGLKSQPLLQKYLAHRKWKVPSP